MKEFIEKLIGRLEEISTKNKCSECPHQKKCDEVEALDNDEQVDLCGATIKALAIDTVKALAEEFAADINVVSKNGWIPCSERLPQEDEPVCVLCQIVNVMLKNGTVTSGWCNRYLEKWYVLDHHHDYPLPFEYKDVIAWQPLPAPYKEGCV